MKNPLFRRFTAAFLTILMLTAQPFAPRAYAQKSVKSGTSAAALTGIALPESLGRVEKTFTGSHSKTVILIQDAHSVPDAQLSIQKIIRYLEKKYGIQNVALEGASRELDPQFFKSFPDQKLLKKVFRSLHEKGELAGGAAAALFDSGQTRYRGIEDWDLYEQGAKLYLQAMGREEEMLGKIKTLKEKIEKRQESLNSKELLEVDAALEKFYQNKSGLSETLEILARRQMPDPQSDLGLLYKKIHVDPAVHERAVAEVKGAAASLEKVLKAKNKTPEERKRWAAFNKQYQAFLTGQANPENFANFLKPLLKSEKLKVSAAVADLAGEEQRVQNIQGTDFFNQFEDYVLQVKEKFFQNDEQRALDFHKNRLNLMERFVKLELSHQDWQTIQDWRAGKPPVVKNGIRLSEDSAPLEQAENSILESATGSFAFYENALKRDQVLFSNLKKILEHSSSSVFVAGGFHTEGMTKLMREEGVSYVLLMPSMKNVPEETNYRAHMKGDVSWKDYLKPENDGRIPLYKSFLRAMRDKLLENNKSVLKLWRDQIIRDLAKQNRLEEAGQYTVFLDELVKENKSSAKMVEAAKKFIEDLRSLQQKNDYTPQNIAGLLKPATSIGLEDGTALLQPDSAAFDPRAVTQARPEIRTGAFESGDLSPEVIITAIRTENPAVLRRVINEMEEVLPEISSGDSVEDFADEGEETARKYVLMIENGQLGFAEWGVLHNYGLEPASEERIAEKIIGNELQRRIFDRLNQITAEDLRSDITAFGKDSAFYLRHGGVEWQSSPVTHLLNAFASVVSHYVDLRTQGDQDLPRKEKKRLSKLWNLYTQEINDRWRGKWDLTAWVDWIFENEGGEGSHNLHSYLMEQIDFERYQDLRHAIGEGLDEIVSRMLQGVTEWMQDKTGNVVHEMVTALNETGADMMEGQPNLIRDYETGGWLRDIDMFWPEVKSMSFGDVAEFVPPFPFWYRGLMDYAVKAGVSPEISIMMAGSSFELIFQKITELRKNGLDPQIYQAFVTHTLLQWLEDSDEAKQKATFDFARKNPEFRSIVYYLVVGEVLKPLSYEKGHLLISQLKSFTPESVDLLEQQDEAGKYLRFYDDLRDFARAEIRTMSEIAQNITEEFRKLPKFSYKDRSGREYKAEVTVDEKLVSNGITVTMVPVHPESGIKSYTWHFDVLAKGNIQLTLSEVEAGVQSGLLTRIVNIIANSQTVHGDVILTVFIEDPAVLVRLIQMFIDKNPELPQSSKVHWQQKITDYEASESKGNMVNFLRNALVEIYSQMQSAGSTVKNLEDKDYDFQPIAELLDAFGKEFTFEAFYNQQGVATVTVSVRQVNGAQIVHDLRNLLGNVMNNFQIMFLMRGLNVDKLMREAGGYSSGLKALIAEIQQLAGRGGKKTDEILRKINENFSIKNRKHINKWLKDNGYPAPGNNEEEDMVRKIKVAAETLYQETNAFLHDQAEEETEVDVNELLDDLSGTSAGTEVKITYDLPEEPVIAFMKRRKFENAMRNIIKNAVEASQAKGAQGNVYVTLRQEGDEFIVTVKDNGSGMTADMADRIFSGRASSTKGTGGIGLNTSRDSILREGGFWLRPVSVLETPETPGSTEFTVRMSVNHEARQLELESKNLFSIPVVELKQDFSHRFVSGELKENFHGDAGQIQYYINYFGEKAKGKNVKDLYQILQPMIPEEWGWHPLDLDLSDVMALKKDFAQKIKDPVWIAAHAGDGKQIEYYLEVLGDKALGIKAADLFVSIFKKLNQRQNEEPDAPVIKEILRWNPIEETVEAAARAHGLRSEIRVQISNAELQSFKTFLAQKFSSIKDLDKKLTPANLKVILLESNPDAKFVIRVLTGVNFKGGQAAEIANQIKIYRNARASVPDSSFFDMQNWFETKYIAALASLHQGLLQGTLTGKKFDDWVDENLRKLAPEGYVFPSFPDSHILSMRDLQGFGERNIRDIFIPRDFYFSISPFDGVSYISGKILSTEMVRTPAGRTIPVYEIEDPNGLFGEGTAGPHNVIISNFAETQIRQAHPLAREFWRRTNKGKELGQFRANPSVYYINLLNIEAMGRFATPEEAVQFIRQNTLAEELSHADGSDYAMRLRDYLDPQFVLDDVLSKGLSVLRPGEAMYQTLEAFRKGYFTQSEVTPLFKTVLGQGPLQNLLGVPHESQKEQVAHIFGEAIFEVEAKLNALRGLSPSPFYALKEPLDGVFWPDQLVTQDPNYIWAFKIIVAALSEQFFGEPTFDRSRWMDFLEEKLKNPAQFNDEIRRAADAAYQKYFVSLEERENIIRFSNRVREQIPAGFHFDIPSWRYHQMYFASAQSNAEEALREGFNEWAASPNDLTPPALRDQLIAAALAARAEIRTEEKQAAPVRSEVRRIFEERRELLKGKLKKAIAALPDAIDSFPGFRQGTFRFFRDLQFDDASFDSGIENILRHNDAILSLDPADSVWELNFGENREIIITGREIQIIDGTNRRKFSIVNADSRAAIQDLLIQVSDQQLPLFDFIDRLHWLPNGAEILRGQNFSMEYGYSFDFGPSPDFRLTMRKSLDEKLERYGLRFNTEGEIQTKIKFDKPRYSNFSDVTRDVIISGHTHGVTSGDFYESFSSADKAVVGSEVLKSMLRMRDLYPDGTLGFDFLINETSSADFDVRLLVMDALRQADTVHYYELLFDGNHWVIEKQVPENPVEEEWGFDVFERYMDHLAELTQQSEAQPRHEIRRKAGEPEKTARDFARWHQNHDAASRDAVAQDFAGIHQEQFETFSEAFLKELEKLEALGDVSAEFAQASRGFVAMLSGVSREITGKDGAVTLVLGVPPQGNEAAQKDFASTQAEALTKLGPKNLENFLIDGRLNQILQNALEQAGVPKGRLRAVKDLTRIAVDQKTQAGLPEISEAGESQAAKISGKLLPILLDRTGAGNADIFTVAAAVFLQYFVAYMAAKELTPKEFETLVTATNRKTVNAGEVKAVTDKLLKILYKTGYDFSDLISMQQGAPSIMVSQVRQFIQAHEAELAAAAAA